MLTPESSLLPEHHTRVVKRPSILYRSKKTSSSIQADCSRARRAIAVPEQAQIGGRGGSRTPPATLPERRDHNDEKREAGLLGRVKVIRETDHTSRYSSPKEEGISRPAKLAATATHYIPRRKKPEAENHSKEPEKASDQTHGDILVRVEAIHGS